MEGLELSLIHISEPTRLLSIADALMCLKKKMAISLLPGGLTATKRLRIIIICTLLYSLEDFI